MRCQGLFDEFLQNIDLGEAVLSAQELVTPGVHLAMVVPMCTSAVVSFGSCVDQMRLQLEPQSVAACACIMLCMVAFSQWLFQDRNVTLHGFVAPNVCLETMSAQWVAVQSSYHAWYR